MPHPLTLMAILAHPDDESLGIGGALARYAAEGVDVHLVTATRGERGRYFTNEDRPGDDEVGRVRERELRAAAAELGARDVRFLDYCDGDLDRVDPAEATARIARHLRRVRPQVVVTFDPFGAYGHPDHIAISQLATAAVAAAGDPRFDPAAGDPGPAGDAALSGDAGAPGNAAPHAVAKLYYFVTDPDRWAAYQAAFKTLISRVDGEERVATAWPGWSITTEVDTAAHQDTVWRAVQRHETQMAVYERLEELTPEQHRALWGRFTFYRVFSRVNGGRATETDLFAGLR